MAVKTQKLLEIGTTTSESHVDLLLSMDGLLSLE
jgi:hypothetical protein